MEEVNRYREGLFKKQVWMSGKQGEGCMIGLNSGGLYGGIREV